MGGGEMVNNIETESIQEVPKACLQFLIWIEFSDQNRLRKFQQFRPYSDKFINKYHSK